MNGDAMQLWDYAVTDGTAMREIATGCPAGSEVFARDDGSGLLVIGQAGPAPETPVVRNVSVLFDGGRYGPDAGEWLFAVGLWTPAEWRTEFLAWYREEHLPMLLECPVWEGCRFVEQVVPDGAQFFALHQFADRSALDSEHRRLSRSTHWFQRLARQPWFDKGFQRTLLRRLPL